LRIDIGAKLQEAVISSSSFRVVTYNIRRCLGSDGRSTAHLDLEGSWRSA